MERISTTLRTRLCLDLCAQFCGALRSLLSLTVLSNSAHINRPKATSMAPTKKTSSSKDVYSVILPTFNERQNLPIITWLLNKTFTEQ